MARRTQGKINGYCCFNKRLWFSGSGNIFSRLLYLVPINYIVQEIKPKLAKTSATLINLIDRIRMLDNDLIRLKTKINTLRKKKSKK